MSCLERYIPGISEDDDLENLLLITGHCLLLDRVE